MIWDWLRGAPAIENDELRKQLFEAAGRGDEKEMARLCKFYTHQILDAFPVWRKIPTELNDDVGALNRWGHGLAMVARHFAEELAQPELIQSLTGKGEDNPLLTWQKALEDSQNMMRDGNFAEARDKLAKITLAVKGLRGTGVDQYLPVTFGMLGECLFQTGDAERAVAPITDAIALCEQVMDREGQLASLSNLYEVHRWRGDQTAAAATAEKLAGVLADAERTNDAARFRKLAGIVRAGEPLVRVLAVVEGKPVELDELNPQPNERVQFVFERNRVALRPAATAVQRGEQIASNGDLETALTAFREAAALDKFDPQPKYLESLTLMHLKRYPESIAASLVTEALAPGWFHCRAQLWMARELEAGRVPHEAFLALRELEDGEAPPEQKAGLAEQVIAKLPELAPVHLALGNAYLALRRIDDARAAFKRGLDCAKEPDVASRLKLRLALSGPPDAEARRLLAAAADPRGNLVAGAMATVALRTAPPA